MRIEKTNDGTQYVAIYGAVWALGNTHTDALANFMRVYEDYKYWFAK